MAKQPPKRQAKTTSAPQKKVQTKSPTKQQDLIGSVVDDMVKLFGNGAAFTPTADTILCKVETWASTRNFLIDRAIQGGNKNIPGGIPFGRLTEIAGRPSSGKTTLIGQAVATTQKLGGVAAVSDTEEALDLSYWEKLGVNLKKLIILPCETVEEVFDKFEKLVLKIKSVNVDVPVMVAWDSLGGTPTKAMREAPADKKFYAEVAKVVGQNLQRLTGLISKEKIALVFANHLYRDMNVKFGDPYESYGGDKVQFFSSLRLRLAKGTAIKIGTGDDDEFKDTIGHMHTVKVLKNKMAPILRTVKTPCLGNHGFYEPYAVYEQSIRQKLIKKSGGWSTLTINDEEYKFQGWKGFQEKILTQPIYGDLAEDVIETYLKD